MKVAFVQALPIMVDAYMILSATLKERGIETEVFIEAFDNNLAETLANSDADLIGFNVLTGSYNWALNMTKAIKSRRDVPVVFGGVHPTFYPEIIDYNYVDFICVGEGEGAFIELTEAIRDGKSTEGIANIGYMKNNKLTVNPPRPAIHDLSTLPFYDRAIYHKYKFFYNLEIYKYHTSRACPYKCSFCFVTNQAEMYSGQKIYREYPIDYVMRELTNIKNDYPKLKTIFFSDEIFGVDKVWAKTLLTNFKEKINLPYTITTRANILTEEFIELLKATGCQLVSLSVETANEDLRARVMKKKIPNHVIIDAGRRLHSAGIKTRVNCIFCFPDETIEDAFANVQLMKDAQVTDPVGFLLQPFPKTEIYDYAVKKGYIKEQMEIDDLDPLVYFRTPIEIPDKKKIIIVQRLFVYACKVPLFDKLLKFLVNVPDNFIFGFMHKVGIAFSHKAFYELSYFGLIKYLISARKLDMKTS